MHPNFPLKLYLFLCKITSKQAYSIPINLTVCSASGRLLSMLLKSMPFPSVTSYTKHYRPKQNSEDQYFLSHTLTRELLRQWNILFQVTFFQKYKTILLGRVI